LNEEYKIIKRTFYHDVVEGTHYEIGKQQGETMLNRNPDSIKWFKSEDNNPKKLGFKNFDDQKKAYEELSPGITDEIEGFAEGMGIKPQEVKLYGPPIYVPGNCSQIAISSSITADKHVYVARSYEYNQDQDDFRLCTARIKGKAKTIGFSSFHLGRSDGFNEHGFCITFTGGGTFKTKPTKKGFHFFLINRALLDNCKTVDEAIKHLEKISVQGFMNLLMTDKNGNAALAQYFDGECAIKRIGEDTKEKIVYSGNHYWLPEMVKHQIHAGDWILKNSKKRLEIIESKLSKHIPKIAKENIRELLSKEIYDGLCGHYYTDYFGTLYSMIFDLTDLKVDICFGAPTHNEWHNSFTLDDPISIKEYPVILPDKSIKLDKLFEN
jgi:predicted choloylglycine hydrolase